MHTYFWTPYAGAKYTTSHRQAVSRIPVYRTVEGSGKPWLSLLGECLESVVIERWGGENGGYERVSGYQPIPRFLTKQEYVRTRGMFRMRVYLVHGINTFGLTACSGDSWRDTVEDTPMIVCVHACGGTDGACHAANDLPGRLSRVCTDASLARPRPQSCTRRYAVPDGGAGRPCASLSGRPYGAH